MVLREIEYTRCIMPVSRSRIHKHTRTAACAHTSGEFLISEDLTGDSEGETEGGVKAVTERQKQRKWRKLMHPPLASPHIKYAWR